MGLGAQLAEATARVLGRDPWVVADRLGVAVLEGPLVGRVHELYLEDRNGPAVVVAEGLPAGQDREALACGLGHHVLADFARKQGEEVPRAGLEHRAEVEEFAAYLLVSPAMVRDALLEEPPSPAAWAKRWALSDGLVRRRLGAAGKRG